MQHNIDKVAAWLLALYIIIAVLGMKSQEMFGFGFHSSSYGTFGRQWRFCRTAPHRTHIASVVKCTIIHFCCCIAVVLLLWKNSKNASDLGLSLFTTNQPASPPISKQVNRRQCCFSPKLCTAVKLLLPMAEMTCTAGWSNNMGLNNKAIKNEN